MGTFLDIWLLVKDGLSKRYPQSYGNIKIKSRNVNEFLALTIH